MIGIPKMFARNECPVGGWRRGTKPNLLQSSRLLGFLTSTATYATPFLGNFWFRDLLGHLVANCRGDG